MQKRNLMMSIGFLGSLLLTQEAVSAGSGDIKSFKRLLSQQSKQLAAQQKVLDAQNRQLNELQSRLDELTGNDKETATTNGKQPTKASPQVETKQPPQATAKAPPSAANQQPQAKADKPRLKQMPKDTRPPEIPRVSADIGGVLTPKGRLVLEPSALYSYSKATRAAIEGFSIIPALTIGIVNVRDVKRETEIAALTGRFGVTDRFELEARVPYLHREDTTQTRRFLVPDAQDRFFNADASDLGDIEVAGHYQFNDGQNGWPFFIGNLRVKTDTGTSPFETPIDLRFNIPKELPTGTGFWSLQPSVTAIFPTDPCRIFWQHKLFVEYRKRYR